jgi:hypothetical protein
MEQSAKLHSLKVENLATKSTWSGWQDRIDAISAKLETLPETDIFCFIDAYDLIVNADEKKILEQFHEIKAPLVFGAEVLLFPFKLQEKESEYPKSPTPFRFLNAGVFIGYVKNLKQMYAWGKQKYPQPVDDDQGFYQAYFLKNPGAITLDHQAKLAINMNQVPWQTLQIVSGHVEFMPFQRAPCFLHFNGMSYMDVDNDFVDMGDNKRGFAYDKVYSRTFLALIGAKFVSERSPLRLQLTSNGHTYPRHKS